MWEVWLCWEPPLHGGVADPLVATDPVLGADERGERGAHQHLIPPD